MQKNNDSHSGIIDFLTKKLILSFLFNSILDFFIFIPFVTLIILSGIFYHKLPVYDLIFGIISVFCFCILKNSIHKLLTFIYLFIFHFIAFISFAIYMFYFKYNRTYEILDLALIYESHFAEICEFIFNPAVLCLIFTGAILTLSIAFFDLYLNKYRRKRTLIKKRLTPRLKYIISGIGLVATVVCLLKGDLIGIRYPRQLAKESIYCQYKLNHKKFIATRKKVEAYLKNRQCKQNDKKNNITCIFVVGDSATAQAMHCYGYPLKNTPFLSGDSSFTYSAGELILLQQCYALNNLTVKVLHQMFSNSDFSNKLTIANSILIYDICKVSGIKTYMISNQLDKISSFAESEIFADHTIFPYNDKSMSRLRYRNILNCIIPPDEILLPAFSKVLSEIDTAKDQLITLHLYGSHIPFKNRIPENFVSSLEKNNLSDAEFSYIRSIEYTDHLLQKIAEITNDKIKNRPYVICYVSDHGEDPENKIARGSQILSGNISSFFDIPCAFFFSEKFCELYPQKIQNLKNNKNKPFVNEHLFDALISIFDINISDKNITTPEKNIFSDQYKQNIDDFKIIDYKYPLRAMMPERHKNVKR